MRELDNLTELQIVKLYNKTNNQRYLDEIDNRIKYIHNSGMDPNKLSNEQLVLLCQKYDEDIYWACVPQCVRYGGCPELFSPCGFYENLMKDEPIEIQMSLVKRYDVYNKKRK